MKKLILVFISVITFFTCNYNVYATDTVYTINKNKDEKFYFTKDSYNSNGKIDGVVAAGSYLKETIEYNDTKYDDYQIMLVKYNDNGVVKWFYNYGKTSEDHIDYLTYTYDHEGNIDGYLLVLENTYDVNQEIIEEQNSLSTFIKVGLDGKQVFEKQSGINNKEKIKKIIPTYNEDNQVDGYISYGTVTHDGKEDSAILIKYDKELNVIWSKEYKNEEYEKTTYLDITNFYENGKVIGYVVIREFLSANSKQTDLIKIDKDGNEEKNIDNTLNKYKTVNLEEAENGFVLYGKTEDVKLKKGSMSYYIIKYNTDCVEGWETIGDTELDTNGKIVLYPRKKDNKLEEYIILCTNKTKSSTQVIKLDNEGTIKNKVKKITNEYYDIEDFNINGDILYFIGQIVCPEDDNCEYDTNSLFIVSNEEKVIEVEDNQSANIMIFIGIFILGCIGISFFKKKKRLKKKKD